MVICQSVIRAGKCCEIRSGDPTPENRFDTSPSLHYMKSYEADKVCPSGLRPISVLKAHTESRRNKYLNRSLCGSSNRSNLKCISLILILLRYNIII